MKHVVNACRSIIDDNVRLDVLLSVTDDPHNNSWQIAADTCINERSVLRVLKQGKYNPHKTHNV